MKALPDLGDPNQSPQRTSLTACVAADTDPKVGRVERGSGISETNSKFMEYAIYEDRLQS